MIDWLVDDVGIAIHLILHRRAYIGWIVILGVCLLDLVSGARPQTQMEQIAKNVASVLIVFQSLVNIFTRYGKKQKKPGPPLEYGQ